jgi:diguanylate cyclase (GGDEF)-like protein/PAS domain S-box-containing protein
MAINVLPDMNDLLLGQALKRASNPIFIVDKAGRTLWCNQAYADLLERPMNLVVHHKAPSLTTSSENHKFFSELWSIILEKKETWFGELKEKKPDGSIVYVDAVITPLTDPNGTVKLFLVLEHDITDRKVEYEKVWQLANYDRLTGLANRSFFTSMFERIITQATRNQKKVAVLFIDLDGFKGVNDTIGHEGGDQVLIETAHVLENFIRKSDIVARFGGDEFACILDEIESIDAAIMIAQKMVTAIGNIEEVKSGKVSVGASIGIALYPDHGYNQTEIRIAADMAMYEAKKQGKNCFHVYNKIE